MFDQAVQGEKEEERKWSSAAFHTTSRAISCASCLESAHRTHLKHLYLNSADSLLFPALFCGLTNCLEQRLNCIFFFFLH